MRQNRQIRYAYHGSGSLNDEACHKISQVRSETRYFYLSVNLPYDCPKQTFLILFFFLTKAEAEVTAPSLKTGAAHSFARRAQYFNSSP